MKEKTNQTQSAVFNYTAPREIRIGDVFYCVETGESRYFCEPYQVVCPKCEKLVKAVSIIKFR